MCLRVFVVVCCAFLLLVWSPCPSSAVSAFSSRFALFWIANQRTLNSAADYEKSFQQWAQQNRSDYILAADAYQLGDDGSLQYYYYGETAEKYAFTTLTKMGLNTQAVFYTESGQGIATLLANPKPIINELINRAKQFSIGGYHVYYEPDGVFPSYGDFLIEFGDALSNHNLTLTVGIMGWCPSWDGLSCQQASNMTHLLGVATWDTFGAYDVPSFQLNAQEDPPALGDKYCPGLLAYNFNSNTWLQLNQYLSQQNYSSLATYAVNYWDQWEQPQWFFDGINTFLDGK